MKKIIIGADDFGQNESITHAIADLVALERINATSLMVNMPYAHQAAKLAFSFPANIKVGLHFNLTEGQALSPSWRKQYGHNFPSLQYLIKGLLLRQIKSIIILNELQYQWEKVTDLLGRVPDMFDGHQHVHQFPVVRQMLSKFLIEQNYTGYCRATYNQYDNLQHYFRSIANMKSVTLLILGARSWSRYLSSHHFIQPRSFFGFYPFSQSMHYRQYFRKFLQYSLADGFIMCHPGLASNDLTDALHMSRVNEFNYLKSSEFVDDCREFKIELAY